MKTTTASFGFARQMGRADFTAFPRWYGARCLLRAAARTTDRRF